MNLINITYTCVSVSLTMCARLKLLSSLNKQMKWNNNNRKMGKYSAHREKYDHHFVFFFSLFILPHIVGFNSIYSSTYIYIGLLTVKRWEPIYAYFFLQPDTVHENDIVWVKVLGNRIFSFCHWTRNQDAVCVRNFYSASLKESQKQRLTLSCYFCSFVDSR